VGGKPEDYAMGDATTSRQVVALPLPRSAKESVLRDRIREAIGLVIEEELEEALGTKSYGRSAGRQGYRNGSQERSVVTEYGPAALTVPRARLKRESGSTTEWHSTVVPRYARRTHRVDEAILGAYLAGANSRRIRKALAPLLGEKALSKSAISRVVVKLRTLFESWRTRDLSQTQFSIVYLDGMYLPVRLARRVVRVPVFAAIGVGKDGHKELLVLDLSASESTTSWSGIVQGLASRGMQMPRIVVLDGNAGLRRAVHEAWPKAKVQRCTKHKLENLLAKAPKHSHPELKRDYHAIVYAESQVSARAAYQSFVRKWSKLSADVVKSLEEAGDELLTFMQFPESQWRALRTTNAIERLNGEFRRRTKTQGSFCNEQAALVLLFGLIAVGQIRMRKIDGHYDLATALEEAA
jgi:transposase-like protein